jgi:hypothetical protein
MNVKRLSAVFLFILTFMVNSAIANEEDAFRVIEEKVFSTNQASVLLSMEESQDSSSAEAFRQGLVEYRLGNMTTNAGRIQKSIGWLEKSVGLGTNVFNLSYLGIAHTGVVLLSGNPIEKSDHLGKAFEVLNRSVELFPDHYLPRFYRSLLNLMVPGVFGGKEEKGIEDMNFVLSRIDTIDRNPPFKAFMVFMYANWLGEKGKDYGRAVALLDRAASWATDKKFLENIEKKRKEFIGKGGSH